MSYKTILAVLQDKDDAARVLDCALPLATRFSAHLIGVHAEAIPVPYVTPMGFPDTDFIAATADANQQRSQEIAALFEERARREDVSREWQAMENVSGDAAIGAVTTARNCDLVIAQQSDPDGVAGAQSNLEALLFDSGRPVLVLPYAVSVDCRFRKVLVAWNGSAQAARATFDALPFILGAEQVDILQIGADDSYTQDRAVAGVDIAASLARHGAKVNYASQPKSGIGVGEAIENQIAEAGVDLLVMGAYSQSWLKEFFFGGATRTLMRSMPTATLMAR